MDKYYFKQYIPGYTGHIPQKIETFGLTAGAINRQLVLKQAVPEAVPKERLYYTLTQPELASDGDKIKYGFRSRYGISWIGGPSHEFAPQHVPCNYRRRNSFVVYQGHVPAVISENIAAKSFARCTRTAILGSKPRGFDTPTQDRYQSTYRKNFSERKNRRFCIAMSHSFRC